ncbi:MAG TPA: glycosyltransferase family 1 protein [Rhodocyclaceae bacterium]
MAFPLIGGRQWLGGFHYLCNLLRTLEQHAGEQIQPFLFLGDDLAEEDSAPLSALTGVTIIRHADFNSSAKSARLRLALLTGCDQVAARHFRQQGIDVAFEPAQFYGWRFPLATVAWIPDFQHRHLRHLFGFGAYWKRELGFRAQVLAKRQIMLSSEDSRRDCERFYPASRDRTHVVRFAVPSPATDGGAARAVADSYGLPQHFFFLPNQFWAHKNHLCVVRALHLLKQRGLDVVVAVTGKQEDARDPSHFPKILKLLDEWNLRDNFRLLGLLPYRHLPALMGSATALINPSFFEGWSTTVEEAKSIGTPLLLSDIPVHREQADGAARFFDPESPEALADALAQTVPLPAEQRAALRAAAEAQSVGRIQAFAAGFVELVAQAHQAHS